VRHETLLLRDPGDTTAECKTSGEIIAFATKKVILSVGMKEQYIAAKLHPGAHHIF
jgi:hypothetical protein